jgi:hypothetical protein
VSAEKWCKGCEENLPLSSFRLVALNSGNGKIPRAICRGCENDRATARWQLANVGRSLRCDDPYPGYLGKGRYGLHPEYMRFVSHKNNTCVPEWIF